MKILQLNNRIPYPLNDGGNIGIYFITKYLHEYGNEVHFLTLNTKKHHQDPKVMNDITSQTYAIDIDTSVTPWGAIKALFSGIPYNIKRFQSKAFAQKLVEILKEHTFDIIQLEGAYMSIYLPLIRKYSQAKVTMRAHNLEHQIWERLAEEEKNSLKSIYLGYLSRGIKKFEQYNFGQVDGIIPVSELDAKYIRQYAKSIPVQTIQAGFDFAETTTDIIPQQNTICMLGSLEWMPNVKGLYWFLEKVWPLLRAQNPKVTLHVAGKNPSPEVMQIKEEGITIHGMVPDAQAFLNSYEILVVPLLSGSGMRIKIVEAMALKKCIVSTAVGAEGILYQDGKDIVIANEPAEMATQLNTLLAQPEQIKNMGIAAQKLAYDKYSWKYLVKDFIQFYKEILS